MGRRRRRVIKIVKKKLPNVFECPKCGENAIRVNLFRESKYATLQCGSCGLKDKFPISKSTEEIDIYCQFIDKINKPIKN